MMRKLLIFMTIILFLPTTPQTDTMFSIGTNLQYYLDSGSFIPEFRIKTATEHYFKLSSEFTLFLDGGLFSNLDLSGNEMITLANTAAELSYMYDILLVRWGIKSAFEYTVSTSAFIYDLTSNLLFSLNYENICIQFSPEILYNPIERDPLNISGKVNLTFSLFEQLILSPAIIGGVSLVTEGDTEYYYTLMSDLDWYPGTDFFFNAVLGFEERFSTNSNTIYLSEVDSIFIPDYYSYWNIYSTLGCNLLLGKNISINFAGTVAFKQMNHYAVLLSQLDTAKEWQFTIKPELEVDITFVENLALVVKANFLQIMSNTEYMKILTAGAELELLYMF